MTTGRDALRQPFILEVNARLLLRRLAERYEQSLTLGTVPREYWATLGRRYQFLWLMGAWERSESSRREALKDPHLLERFPTVLPGWTPEDVGGSPYAVHRYQLDPALGEPGELATLRDQLHEAGTRLLLDFVPNHVARDHPWTRERPDFFVRPRDLARPLHPGWFFTTPEGVTIAHGRDPHFPPWTDTAQLDFTSRSLREALIEELLGIARVADGVRCDMAMLALNDVHEETWGAVRAPSRPRAEFWGEAIARVRREHPDFVFIAEAYWELEPRLIALGFDYAYDKGLYDALRTGAGAVRRHLAADPLDGSAVRFIENHDETRAADAFGREQALAAAAIAATLPGVFLVHDGQIEGRREHLPVQLLREPDHATDHDLVQGYEALFDAIGAPPIGSGHWRRLAVDVLEGQDPEGLLAWAWESGERSCVVIVNYSPAPLTGIVEPGWATRSASNRLASPPGSPPAISEIVEIIEVALSPWEVRLLDVALSSTHAAGEGSA